MNRERAQITSCGLILKTVCSFSYDAKGKSISYPTTNFFNPSREITDKPGGISNCKHNCLFQTYNL